MRNAAGAFCLTQNRGPVLPYLQVHPHCRQRPPVLGAGLPAADRLPQLAVWPGGVPRPPRGVCTALIPRCADCDKAFSWNPTWASVSSHEKNRIALFSNFLYVCIFFDFLCTIFYSTCWGKAISPDFVHFFFFKMLQSRSHSELINDQLRVFISTRHIACYFSYFLCVTCLRTFRVCLMRL